MTKLGFYDLGRLLGHAMTTNDKLFLRFADKAGLGSGPFVNRQCDATPWTGGGKNERPTDVLVIAKSESSGAVWGLHIRNLVRSSTLDPDQAADYPVRAKEMADLRGYDAWRTILLVSRSRLRDVQWGIAAFDVVIFHDEIADLVPEFNDAL